MTEEELAAVSSDDTTETTIDKAIDQDVKKTDQEFMLHLLRQDFTQDDIPESVYRAYLRSLLGGTQFTYTFNLFDGKAAVTFTEVPYAVADKYQKVLLRLKDFDISYVSCLAMLVYTESIVLPENTYKGTKDIKDSWLDTSTPIDDVLKDIKTEYTKCFGTIKESLHRVIPVLWTGFNVMLTFLVQRGMPKSF